MRSAGVPTETRARALLGLVAGRSVAVPDRAGEALHLIARVQRLADRSRRWNLGEIERLAALMGVAAEDLDRAAERLDQREREAIAEAERRIASGVWL